MIQTAQVAGVVSGIHYPTAADDLSRLVHTIVPKF